MTKTPTYSVGTVSKLYRVTSDLRAHVATSCTQTPSLDRGEPVFEPFTLSEGDEVALDGNGMPFVNIDGRLHPIRLFCIALNIHRLDAAVTERGLTGEAEHRFRNFFPFTRAIIEGQLAVVPALPRVQAWPYVVLDQLPAHVFDQLIAGGDLFRSMLTSTEWQVNTNVFRPPIARSFSLEEPASR